MNAEELRQLASEYLLPFFSGAEIEAGTFPSTALESCVASVDPCTIAFKIMQVDHVRLRIRRSQAFEADNAGVVTEKSVVSAFVEAIRSIESGLQQPYRADLLASLERRVVGKPIADAEFEPVLLKTLDQMANWSSRQYEGHQITSAIGFVPNDTTQSVAISDAWKIDFSGYRGDQISS